MKTKRRKSWQLQTAKAQFSEVFRRARTEGPQVVTKQGREAVVILPKEEYDRLKKSDAQPKGFADFIAQSPLRGSGINLERVDDFGRDIEL